jgi:hypothetical protein
MNIGKLRKPSRLTALTYLSLALLAAVTLYCAWYANYYQAGNADDIVYPYLFQHFQAHDIILPGQHANLLKLPIFVLQAVLPYNFSTFTIVNLSLVLVTTLAWVILLIWLLGRRYAPLICLSLASVLLGSQLLNYDLMGTTIRNIEFPIVLAFIIYTGTLLQKHALSRRKLIIGGVVGLLFSLTIAGDSFFLYTVCFSLLLVLAFYWLTGEQVAKLRQQYRLAAAYAIGFSVLALVIRLAVSVLGITKYYTAGVFKPHVLPLNHLAPSISTATTQLLNLFDANIFGLAVRPGNSLVFLNFLLLALGLAGLAYMLRDSLDAARRQNLLKRLNFTRVFTLAVMSLTFFVTYVVYIVADLVVMPDANGNIVSFNQERYLVIAPLLLVAGIAYLVWRKFSLWRLVFVGLPAIILFGLLINSPSIKRSHVYDSSLRAGPIAVAKAAKANHVPLLVTGYWYGSSTRFWSHGQIAFAGIANCNIPEPTFNNRFSWYKPDLAIHKSALVVSRSGPDAQFWVCSDARLTAIYGNPVKVAPVGSNGQTSLWIYNYDVRSRLSPLTL